MCTFLHVWPGAFLGHFGKYLNFNCKNEKTVDTKPWRYQQHAKITAWWKIPYFIIWLFTYFAAICQNKDLKSEN